MKRALDVVASGSALLTLASVAALIALAVRLEGGPGVPFKQVRVGVDGRHFQLLEFRSLRPVDQTESATHHAENWSLWLDVKIIIRTAGAIFTRAGS